VHRRFGNVSMLPNLALVLLVLALLAGGAPAEPPNAEQILSTLDRLSLVRVAAVVALVVIVSLILHPFQFSLVRLLEGYWDATRFGRAIGGLGRAFHRRRRQRLEQAVLMEPETPAQMERLQQAAERLAQYPSEERLLPTKLGNTLRAAEDEAGARYGLPTVVTMPRLYPYLSDRFAAVYTDRRNQLDVAVRFCVVLVLATVIAFGLLAANGGLWLLLPLLTGLLAWTSYQGAVRAAAAYGQALFVAFDLHRFDMLKALHYPLPANLDDELNLNQRVAEFFMHGVPIQEDYWHEQGQHRRSDDRSQMEHNVTSSQSAPIRAYSEARPEPDEELEPWASTLAADGGRT
jgi:hypothetical protein